MYIHFQKIILIFEFYISFYSLLHYRQLKSLELITLHLHPFIQSVLKINKKVVDKPVFMFNYLVKFSN